MEKSRPQALRRRWIAVLAVLALVSAACTADDAGGATTTTSEGATTTEASDTTMAQDDGATTTTQDDDGEQFGTLTVGLLNPLTGIFALLGGDTNRGFDLYVEQQGGTLAGWEIETVVEDDAGDPTEGNAKVRKLVEQDEIDVLIGGVSSGVAYGIADYVAESEVPYIITIAGADGLTQRDAVDNIFRISYTGSQPMHPLGEYTCEELGHQTATVVSLDFAFGWETAGGFARTYEDAGCDVVQEIYVPLGTEDYAPFVQQISRDSDVVMHVNSGPASNLFWQTYRDFGYEQPVVGHGAITDEALLATEDTNAVGALTTFYWSRAAESELSQSFVEAFESEYDALVSQGAEAGYAVAMVLEAALDVAGADAQDPSALNAAIGQVEVEVPRGPIQFDEFGQAVMNFYIRETVVAEDDPDVNKKNEIIHTFPDVSQFWTFSPEEYLDFEPYTELTGTWESN